jgi:uncharacterized protein YcgL (UPF0745 family)
MKLIVKQLLLLICVLIILVPIWAFPIQPHEPLSGNRNTENTISWNKYYKLKPSDFQGKKNRNYKGTAAITASSFGFSIVDDNGNISGNIFVRFYRDDSWWNPDNNNSNRVKEILDHEQLHFDITELFGRKLYKEILKLKSNNKLNNKTVERVYKTIEKQYHNYQDDYDRDTAHSLNKNEQAEWEKRISSELEQYSGYSDYHQF